MTIDYDGGQSILSKDPNAKFVRTVILLILSFIIAIPYFVYILPYFKTSQLSIVASLLLFLIFDYFAYIFVLSRISGIPFFRVIRL
jgi:hypothetical protein